MAKKTPIVSEVKALKHTSRKASTGDIITGDTPEAARAHTVNRRLRAKLNSEAAALKNAMRYMLTTIPYRNKDANMIGRVDQLNVGRSNVIYEKGKDHLLEDNKFGKNKSGGK